MNTVEHRIITDLGRCAVYNPKDLTDPSRPVSMWDFVADHAKDFPGYTPEQAEYVASQASRREDKSNVMGQEVYDLMGPMMVDAVKTGKFVIDYDAITPPDTISFFQEMTSEGYEIDAVTSFPEPFARILLGKKVLEERTLADYVTEYITGDKVGDKNDPQTWAGIYQRYEGNIDAIIDDKKTVVEAANGGIEQALERVNPGQEKALNKGKMPAIYLMDRHRKYEKLDMSKDRKELEDEGIKIVKDYSEIHLDCEIQESGGQEVTGDQGVPADGSLKAAAEATEGEEPTGGIEG